MSEIIIAIIIQIVTLLGGGTNDQTLQTKETKNKTEQQQNDNANANNNTEADGGSGTWH